MSRNPPYQFHCLSCPEPTRAEIPAFHAGWAYAPVMGRSLPGFCSGLFSGEVRLLPLPEAGPGAASGPPGRARLHTGYINTRHATDSHLRGSLPYQLAVRYACLEPAKAASPPCTVWL